MSNTIIEVDELSIKFLNTCIFNSLSFKIPQGSLFAITGPNGSGKTSLLRAILGLIHPVSGSIRIDGKRPGTLPRQMIGYVPQVKTLDRTFPGKSIELVMTGLKSGWPWHIRKEDLLKVHYALEIVGACGLIHKPIGKLSGGELQRVYLARSFIRQPKVLLLDEPVAGIDPGLQDNIYTILETIQREIQATVIMVTHDLAVALYQANLALLMNQNIYYFGMPQHILTEKNLREVFGLCDAQYVAGRKE